MFSVTIPIKTVNSSNGSHGHWRPRAKRMKAEKEAAYSLTKAVPLPAIVTMTRLSPSKLDEGDNLPGALKSIRDGIALRLGVDDGGDSVKWKYGQRKCKLGEEGVIVEIRPVSQREIESDPVYTVAKSVSWGSGLVISKNGTGEFPPFFATREQAEQYNQSLDPLSGCVVVECWVHGGL